MASPMVEGRLDPHKKALFTLDVSDRIADGEVGDYTSVKYNHKPVQPTSSRTTTLTSTGPNAYALKLEDQKEGNKKDVFVFTGQKTAPKKSYILLFDPATQKATLEPLASTYTFNISKKNGADISSTYSKIYPRKQKDDGQDAAAGDDDLFDESAHDDIDAGPDADNPFDFRHFLSKERAKRGDESEYNTVSSPDYRTGTGSALNTPQFTARRPAAAATSKAKAPTQAAPKPKKRKSPEPEQRKPAPKKQVPPTVRLERRATQQKPEPAKPAKPARKAAAAPPASKIKSAEIIHSSDESDADADGEADPELAPSPARPCRSPSPVYRPASPESDEDEEMEDVGGASALEIEIEVPDARPSKPTRPSALSSLGLGYGKSPSAGPISLASAANSVEGSPNPHGFQNRNTQDDDGVIDFGDLGGGIGSDEDADGDDDVDVEPMDIGPPAQRRSSGGGMALDEGDADGEEEDPLVKAMMMGLAGGDSSEESEEE
ncbi:hypothetical protein K458DRAFT_340829 [Lentithecium fluviatile CBS 122367]|uniref:Transcription elongation factor Eaf N-terminal domain-containing protein n=1 Tax=Lentithecium fluviatile CBS 122367 TaxID=1168545 RepID=A0A6G1IXJ1_9PLEO|nr:hypothetical protein K458DRAFT_340829 [Lentithecium fluviatile CBS 122367]